MRFIFESEKDFEDAYMEFKSIKTNFALSKFIIKKLSNKKQKTGFVWQMQGNQVVPAIKDSIDSFNDDTDYQTVGKDMTPIELVSDRNSHLYETKEEADADTSQGVYIIVNFTYMSPKMRNFIISTIKEDSGYYLGSGWRFIVTGNVDDGDSVWMPEYWDLFESVLYEPVPVSKLAYDSPDSDDDDEDGGEYRDDDEDDDEEDDIEITVDNIDDYDMRGFNESFRGRRGRRNSIRESMASNYRASSLDDMEDEIYSILYNAARNGEISPDEYIYIDDDCVMVDTPRGFDRDMMRRAKRADLFIDFDALEDGEVIIYTGPLNMFIEENVI